MHVLNNWKHISTYKQRLIVGQGVLQILLTCLWYVCVVGSIWPWFWICWPQNWYVLVYLSGPIAFEDNWAQRSFKKKKSFFLAWKVTVTSKSTGVMGNLLTKFEAKPGMGNLLTKFEAKPGFSYWSDVWSTDWPTDMCKATFPLLLWWVDILITVKVF